MKPIQFKLAADMPMHQRVIFNYVGNRLNQILHLHATDYPLEIKVEVKAFDGKGGMLGQAGPTVCLVKSGLPIEGLIELDEADLETMISNGTATDVITHEALHVLGYGTLWDMNGLIKWKGGSDPQYIGLNALDEYRLLANNDTLRGVPLENTGGPGTREGHWRETVFQDEIATGYISGSVRPLSRLTLSSLADLGYQVDLAQADAYSLPLPRSWSLMAANAAPPRPHSKCPEIKFIDDLSKAA